ncbi:uncharacterized protein LOC132169087 [Corylus avellana]|uniref:uncharacterized protein LOC132169087 n=1 Tax=Corylus avellana TaxID=13451 RepID=UPI00286A2766|nr:uncharacterized protein LOC132169087 [Corylus avellana]
MGDSEEDCDIHHHPIMGDDQGDIAAMVMADDDAESCSYDSFDSLRVDDDLDDCHHLDLLQASVNDDDDDDAKSRRKSSVSVDSSDEFMDEAEKNRLFWEACLAS